MMEFSINPFPLKIFHLPFHPVNIFRFYNFTKLLRFLCDLKYTFAVAAMQFSFIIIHFIQNSISIIYSLFSLHSFILCIINYIFERRNHIYHLTHLFAFFLLFFYNLQILLKINDSINFERFLNPK